MNKKEQEKVLEKGAEARAKEKADEEARRTLTQNFKNTITAFTEIEDFDKFKKERGGEVTEVIQDEVWGYFEIAKNNLKNQIVKDKVKRQEETDKQQKNEYRIKN